jgi:hypothetical protein
MCSCLVPSPCGGGSGWGHAAVVIARLAKAPCPPPPPPPAGGGGWVVKLPAGGGVDKREWGENIKREGTMN